ncbi:MAG: SLC13 family permease [Haloplanus sp.]
MVAAAPLTAAAISTDTLVLFDIVVFALGLFVTKLVPIDVTAIFLTILLMAFGSDGVVNLTHISTAEGVSGFSNPAALTVLAMLILSSGISWTGFVQILGRKMAAFAASTAFLTPVGYQTNLFVYDPGGHKFTDYVRVESPL